MRDAHAHAALAASSLLELDLEASDSTLRRHEEAALRVSEHQNPFAASRLQPFHALSEQAVERALRQFRERQARCKARQAQGLRAAQLHALDDQWKLVKEQSDIRVYRHAARRHKTTSMLAQGMLRGSLAEIMDGLYAETTKEARVLFPLLGSAFLDVAVLHVDSYRTAQHPFQFAGALWFALETPSGYGVCKARDFLCFEKMGTIKDPEGGDDLGFLTLLSLDQSEGSSSPWLRASPSATADCVRGFLSLTAFFKKLPNGLVTMCVQGDFNARGHLASRLADHMFADLVFALGNAAKCGQAKSLAMLLQSISAGQLPPGGLVASASGSHVSHLLPLLSERNRDRCGVCCKTLWRVIESPEFCRSCWTRTCRHCYVTMPIYCVDFHRAHDEDTAAAGNGARPGVQKKKKLKRLPKPCKETFCLKCVCSVLPNGIKMNAKLLKRTAKKKRRSKRLGVNSVVTDPSLLRRGVGRTALSNGPAPSVITSTTSRGGGKQVAPVARPGGGGGGGGSTSSSSRSREPGKLYVQIPRPHHYPHRARGFHFDDHSSISALSSVESEKLQRQRLSLTKAGAYKPPSIAGTPPLAASMQPTSMLEVLENFQLSQMTTTMSVDFSEHPSLLQSDDGMSYKTYSSASGEGAIHPAGLSTVSPKPARKLQLVVSLTPRKRARRSSTVSSKLSSVGSHRSSKQTNPTSSLLHSPQPKRQLFDEAYYNRVLQQYLDKRPIVSTSSSMRSMEQFQSIDKSSAEATAMAAAAVNSRFGMSHVNSGGSGRFGLANVSSGGSSIGHDSHKMRVLRGLQPYSMTSSFLDRPETPSRLSLSSMSSVSSVSSDAAGTSLGFDHPGHKRPKGDWAPAAY